MNYSNFVHNCPNCKLFGRIGIIDVYTCTCENDGAVFVTARYGPKKNDNISMRVINYALITWIRQSVLHNEMLQTDEGKAVYCFLKYNPLLIMDKVMTRVKMEEES